MQQPANFEEYHKLLMELLNEKSGELEALRNRKSSNGGGMIWKLIASVAGTALLAFGGLWLTFGQHALTKEDAKEMIAAQFTPIKETQSAHSEKLDVLGKSIWRVETDLKIVQDRLGIAKKTE